MVGNRGIAGMGGSHDLFHLPTNTDIHPTQTLVALKQALFILIGTISAGVCFDHQSTTGTSFRYSFPISANSALKQATSLSSLNGSAL